MPDTPSTLQTFLVSFARSLAIIPPIAVIAGAGLYFYMKANDAVLSPGALGASHDPAAMDLTLDQASGGVLGWFLASAVIAWGLSTLFVLLAALTRPGTARAERGLKWAWWLLFVIALAALIGLAMLKFADNDLGFDLNAGFYVPTATATVVGLAVLFWFTSLFATPPTMSPSVPGSHILPHGGRRA